jgi:hypothetical protein
VLVKGDVSMSYKFCNRYGMFTDDIEDVLGFECPDSCNDCEDCEPVGKEEDED